MPQREASFSLTLSCDAPLVVASGFIVVVERRGIFAHRPSIVNKQKEREMVEENLGEGGRGGGDDEDGKAVRWGNRTEYKGKRWETKREADTVGALWLADAKLVSVSRFLVWWC